ncbi:GntP family gluconate:H+ symporter [Motilibacter peucedani]|uniref:GntP family gluconate:H+ symporter n=1 Tax=Motilibacter peucedani TaxID=598650 RepID=A0A420XU74_9ACTN|nr:gluconate:H+ symporter [Motilibacter peucedani]RKS80393.1 GntP family gluconate:H+ symporter [Motilibacter peucedani]
MLVAAAAAGSSSGTDTRLVVAALLGIALIIGLITALKLHPFVSLTLGALLAAGVSGFGLSKGADSFSKGFGTTTASVGILIALGAMLGRLLVDSGGADQIVDTLVGRAGPTLLPWAMALVGALVGLPMFFEIGLVLLMPVIALVAARSGQPLMRVAVPAIAGLSAMHGFVPPHPGPLVAIGLLKADLGLTLGLGILVAIPSLLLAGPLFGSVAARWVPVGAPPLYADGGSGASAGAGAEAEGGAESEGVGEAARRTRRPSFAVTLATVLLPVVLMLGKSLADVLQDSTPKAQPRQALDLVGSPMIALLIGVLVALFSFGTGVGLGKEALAGVLDRSLPPIAGILLIVAAGGGFKQVLVDSGIAKVISGWVEDSSLSTLFLAWLIAVFIRLATGSATVATTTTAGILVPVTSQLSNSHTSLLVLAIGAGSLFFSHVNDAGFWLTKEYLGLSVGQTIKTWSVLETILSVSGLAVVLALSVVV